MKALFLLNLRRSSQSLALSLLLYPALTTLLRAVFRTPAEDMGVIGGFAYVISLLVFARGARDSGFRFSDQWLLILPEPRGGLIFYSWLNTFANFLLGAFNAAGCTAIYFLLYANGPLTSPNDVKWKNVWRGIWNVLEYVATIASPKGISIAGSLFLIAGGLLVFGNSKLYETWIRNLRPPPQARRGQRFLATLARAAGVVLFVVCIFRVPALGSWILLAAFAYQYPKMLAQTFALSAFQARKFSLVLSRGPAAIFAGYFFAVLAMHTFSARVERREIASVYAHSLVGHHFLPDRQLRHLADPNLSAGKLRNFREDYFETYGSWHYGSDFPVSFTEAILTKTSAEAITEAALGYDSLAQTDSDAEAFLAKMVATRKSFDPEPDFGRWSRFHPSENFTLALLSANDPLLRSFGLYVAMQARASENIRAALVATAKSPTLSNKDLSLLAESLSVQMGKEITIAWALHANPQDVRQTTRINCEAKRKWTDPEVYPAFVNVCLRAFISRAPLVATSESASPAFQRAWIGGAKIQSVNSALLLWEKRAR